LKRAALSPFHAATASNAHKSHGNFQEPAIKAEAGKKAKKFARPFSEMPGWLRSRA